MNGIQPCKHCNGDGFEFQRCGCHEAMCPHEPFGGDPSEPRDGLYFKYWVRRTDGSSRDGEKHADCECFVLDLVHDKYARAAVEAYASACEAEFPDLAIDLRARLDAASKKPKGKKNE